MQAELPQASELVPEGTEHNGFKITLNSIAEYTCTVKLACGESWGRYAGVNKGALPCTMKVGYARVFQKK